MLRQSIPKLKSAITFCKTIDGKNQKFVFEELRRDRIEQYVDFYINYHAKEEITHRLSGLYKYPEALAEYKELLSETFSDPSYINVLCRPQNSDEIVSISNIKLVRKHDVEKNLHEQMVKTSQLKRFLNILKKRNELCPTSEIMSKYGVDTMFVDVGGTVHPDYRRLGINHQNAILRFTLCKDNGIPLIGVWATAMGTQKVIEINGWETFKEFSKNELEQAFGAKFDFDVNCFKYVVWKNDLNCV